MDVTKLGSIREFRQFYPLRYGNDPHFKDNKTSLLPLVCGERGAFRQNSHQEMVAVTDEGRRLCQCVLIRHKNAPDTLNLAFFEALPDSGRAVDLLLDYARDKGVGLGCKKLLAGMDGHLNYALGFAQDGEGPPRFGDSYNPSEYAGYFGGFAPMTLSSYWDDAALVRRRVEEDCRRLAPRLARYELEPAGLGRDSLRRYTDLCNEIFADHPCSFRREYAEDAELFAPLRFLLGRENLLFLKDEGREIGLVFYYPDFNELVPPGRGLGVAGALKSRLGYRPRTVKMVEIGVLPAYRRTGVVALAFLAALDAVWKKYGGVDTVATSWVMDRNQASALFARRYTQRQGGRFAVYEQMISK